MKKKPGTKLPTLAPEEWIRILRALGITPRTRSGSHVIYDIPGYSEYAGSGQPYVVDLNWPEIPSRYIRLILRLCDISEDRFWQVR